MLLMQKVKGGTKWSHPIISQLLKHEIIKTLDGKVNLKQVDITEEDVIMKNEIKVKLIK